MDFVCRGARRAESSPIAEKRSDLINSSEMSSNLLAFLFKQIICFVVEIQDYHRKNHNDKSKT